MGRERRCVAISNSVLCLALPRHAACTHHAFHVGARFAGLAQGLDGTAPSYLDLCARQAAAAHGDNTKTASEQMQAQVHEARKAHGSHVSCHQGRSTYGLALSSFLLLGCDDLGSGGGMHMVVYPLGIFTLWRPLRLHDNP